MKSLFHLIIISSKRNESDDLWAKNHSGERYYVRVFSSLYIRGSLIIGDSKLKVGQYE